MKNDLGNEIAKFSISIKESITMLKYATPSIFIPIVTLNVQKNGWLKGMSDSILISVIVSAFLSNFLVVMFSIMFKTKIYEKGLEAMSTGRKSGGEILWSDIASAAYGRIVVFKTIEIDGNDGRRIVLFKNIKDKDKFKNLIVSLAGSENPLCKLLSKSS